MLCTEVSANESQLTGARRDETTRSRTHQRCNPNASQWKYHVYPSKPLSKYTRTFSMATRPISCDRTVVASACVLPSRVLATTHSEGQLTR